MGMPPLAEFIRWMNEMPAAFSAQPAGFPDGKVPVQAVVADLFEKLFNDRPDESLSQAFLPANQEKLERSRLRWVLIACYVLSHPAFRGQTVPRAGVEKLMVQDLASLSAVVSPDALASDETRREELIRRVVGACGLLLAGETKKDSDERLAQLDSVERHRVLAEAATKEKRARQIREEMARKAAAAAAAKVSRE